MTLLSKLYIRFVVDMNVGLWIQNFNCALLSPVLLSIFISKSPTVFLPLVLILAHQKIDETERGIGLFCIRIIWFCVENEVFEMDGGEREIF